MNDRKARCKLCRGERTQPLYRHVSGWPLWRCRDCGLLFFNLPEEAWPDYWAGGSTPNLKVYTHPRVLQAEVARFERYLDWLEARLPPGTLLDYGCGVGTFLACARRRGWQGYGVDRSSAAVSQARAQGLNVRLPEETWPPQPVDVVTLWDVLEHLPDPHRSLSWLAARLKPGGTLLLETPDAAFPLRRWSLRLARWSRGRIDGARFFFYPDHQTYFTQEQLRRLLEEHGFRVEQLRRTCTSPVKVVHKVHQVHQAPAWQVGMAWGATWAGRALGGNKWLVWATKQREEHARAAA